MPMLLLCWPKLLNFEIPFEDGRYVNPAHTHTPPPYMVPLSRKLLLPGPAWTLPFVYMGMTPVEFQHWLRFGLSVLEKRRKLAESSPTCWTRVHLDIIRKPPNPRSSSKCCEAADTRFQQHCCEVIQRANRRLMEWIVWLVGQPETSPAMQRCTHDACSMHVALSVGGWVGW